MKKFLFALFVLVIAGQSQAAERRIALVIGNANYQTGALPTSANDAGLIAQTLQAAGFDVTGARDLDQESLRRAFRDFLEKASSSAADTVAYVYLSGYGLQLEGENYFVPIDAHIPSDANVSSEALRLSDYLKPLAALHLKATVVVLDLARANPFAKTGTPLAGGLALLEPDPNTLIAFNAAPGTVAPNETGPYSAYAEALASISRDGGITLDEVFTRVRLRVNETTNGAEVPWQSSKLDTPIYLFERTPDAPAPEVTAEQTSSLRAKPIRDFDARDAYLAALDRDTLQGYLDFVAAYPRDPMAPRVRALIAARREAITWRHTRRIDTPPAYWSYLRRYPRGAHSYDARRRLRELAVAFEPPPDFTVIEYDVPPPPPDEIIYVERPVLVFDDPDFDFAPPPPPSVIFLPPSPVYFVDLPPPPPPVIAFVLPIPVYRPVPVWVAPPRYITPPPSNIIYNNVHNTVVINNTTNMVTITNQQGQSQTVTPAAALARPSAPPAPGVPPAQPSSSAKVGVAATGLAAAGAAAVLAPSLPAALAKKAAVTPSPPPAPPAKPLAPGRVLRTHTTAPAVQQSAPANSKAAPLKIPEQVKPGSTTPAGAKPAAPPPAGAAPKESGRPIGQPLPGARGGQPLPGHKESPTPAPKAAGAAERPNHETAPPAVTRRPPASPPPAATKPSNPPAAAKHETGVPPSPSVASPPPSVRTQRPASNPPKHVAPQVPASRRAPSPAAKQQPPAVRHATTPPPVVHAPPRAPSPPAAHRTAPPPPRVVHTPPRAPAPPVVHRAAPPPPAAHAPPPAARPAPPRVVAPPPQAKRPAPAAPAAAKPAPKACVLPNGKPCPKR